MKKNNLTRRQFLTAASAGTLTAAAIPGISSYANIIKKTDKLAILGGEPVRNGKSFPKWPYADEEMIESILKTTKSGIWCRIQSKSGTVPTFENEFAELMGTKFCVATGSGTQALHTCVEALGIGPGDEVITSPLTDPGTISSIMSSRALPVLADIDRQSFHNDPAEIEKKITENTKAIMPVDIGGQPCDMDSIMEIAKKHNLVIIEDSCQTHLAKYKGKTLGTIGKLGCFSFQSSKTMACGEGGAIIGNDEELMDKCFTVHNHGTSRKGRTEVIGPKYRMNEFEAAILLGQMHRVKEQFALRNKNAAYLTEKLKGFPGVTPQKLYEGTDSGSFYLYMMSYHKDQFDGVDRDKFLKALGAEGVSLTPYLRQGLHKEPWVEHVLNSKVNKKMFSAERLKKYREENNCPTCDNVCDEIVMIWASGPLLGTQEDMDDIVNAIFKVYENRDKLL